MPNAPFWSRATKASSSSGPLPFRQNALKGLPCGRPLRMRLRGTGALGEEPASITGTLRDKVVDLDALAKRPSGLAQLPVPLVRVRSMCARIAILLLSFIAFAIGLVTPTLGQGVTGQSFVLPKTRAWTGDFSGMLKRKKLRLLVPYSKTLFFVDRGRQMGVVAEFALYSRGVDQCAVQIQTASLPCRLASHRSRSPVPGFE